ncbi:U3 small nucleolar ribonucleoprotein protein IMP4 [Drosophila pseudoobscura]|uniref:U3 small nucleolar ribonucleoprotein protein IMP4 n=1 Tax=Drosophila pseudoobscura pseudoobscura TaxID=46245 RepID=B5DU68_DROPS|nr:U3 small nucleolar ribonucleoprotein protein IMP4 [Drosophila pseudoobscura]
MLRKQARQRREYLYSKALSERLKSKKRVQDSVVQSLDRNKTLNSPIVAKGIDVYSSLKYDDKGIEVRLSNDEYDHAGCQDPKIMLTTSHNPSSRLKMFMKELRLIFPNAQQMNRGKYQLTTLMHACRANNVTDFLIVHEHRGIPDSLVICHLPYGPTSFFNISDVIMRHDIPDIGHMSEQKPHLIFNNFKSPIGLRTVQILKHLFPVPKENSQRVISFLNHNDSIIFRHHQYKNINRELSLSEIGPRFVLKLYQIKLGTLENIKAADTEWVNRPYLNTSNKKQIFSNESGLNN